MKHEEIKALLQLSDDDYVYLLALEARNRETTIEDIVRERFWEGVHQCTNKYLARISDNLPFEHCYCTSCLNFEIDNNETPQCRFSTTCDLCDPEDSRPRYLRPFYIPIREREEK